MSRRLVIPAGDTPSTLSWIVRNKVTWTWQQVADDNQCDGIENVGSQWCLDNGINGLGIATEKLPEPPPDTTPGLRVDVPNVNLDTLIAGAQSTIVAQLDPNVADPTVAQLVRALCIMTLAIAKKAGL